MDPKESLWLFPINKINQKCIMPESNRGSRWWRNRIGKKRDSSCKISNKTVAGIEISSKEKDLKYLEFLFLSYTDDPIRKDRFFSKLGSGSIGALSPPDTLVEQLNGDAADVGEVAEGLLEALDDREDPEKVGPDLVGEQQL
ncbi:Protein ycf2 [Acorus calamus]|uniref:Protein ycf2 n=1 Tax=Acorus calamus TaxID=4465 RepID=A0AAV9DHH6_ACOCL|nr:Protein ycf2 [Acorus calamus]